MSAMMKKKKSEKNEVTECWTSSVSLLRSGHQLQYRMLNASKLHKSNISTIKKMCFIFLHLLPISVLHTLKRAKYSEDENYRERVLHGKRLLSYQICSITNYSISS